MKKILLVDDHPLTKMPATAFWKPVSLHPLEPEDALAGLFQVRPENEDAMGLGPKKRYALAAVCRECGYHVEQEVAVEQINLQSEQVRFIGEAARQHQQHPDPIGFHVDVAEL